MQSYIDHRWHQDEPPFSFFLRGRKPLIDFNLGAIIPPADPREGWMSGIGKGRQEDDIHFYKDHGGTRLIVFIGAYDAPYTVILSSISRHRAQKVQRDLTGLRTGPGVGLGDTKQQVLDNLGQPSETDHYSSYEILMYLGEPRSVNRGNEAATKYQEGYAKAIILKKGHVVEIWVHFYSNAPVP